jgi:hypothetical protein
MKHLGQRWRRGLVVIVGLFCASLPTGCASSKPQTPVGDSAVHPKDRDGSHVETTDASAPAADSGTPHCRGRGRYESEEGTYLPCCEGLNEVSFRSPARDADNKPICADLPVRNYACIRGTCGDGECEKAESDACGCLDDCPQAAWDTLQSPSSASIPGASVSTPASCSKDDVLGSLQISGTTIDCGDLPLEPTREEEAKAIACVRDAIEHNAPFHAFYHWRGDDGVVDMGMYATLSGAGELVTYTVVVDADWSGLQVQGASVSWWPCPLIPRTDCEGVPLGTCIACSTALTTSNYVCGCLPEGPRPGLPDGESVEVLCQELPRRGPGL